MGTLATYKRIAPQGVILHDELIVLIADRFIQRTDVKAVQLKFPDKEIYTPDREIKPERLGPYAPLGFRGRHILQHLNGEATYGHYMLDSDSMCKMFAFDIDLEVNSDTFTGYYMPHAEWQEGVSEEAWEQQCAPVAFNPRQAWLERDPASRPWTKMQMGILARRFVNAIQKETGLPCAAAYSGSKGIHVYGFTGPMPAEQVRAAAVYVIESTGDWRLAKGHSIYKHKVQDPDLGYPNFSVEVYPKQGSLDGKDLGNLMRLPLGRNLKSEDPCFFLDLNTPAGVMAPHQNPAKLLATGDPYA